jgi:3-oxoacyl-[acyl-carrier protein] reductase
MADLRGKVAVVTGAAKGIGAEIAKQLAAAGASIVVSYAASKEVAERVVGEIVGTDGRAIAIQGDLPKGADVRRLFEETKAAFRRLDILVNNAGIVEFGPIEAVTEDQYHRLFDTNVLGMVLTIQEALAYFGPDGGSVINIGSVASVSPSPGSLVYTKTKGAVSTLTRGLAAELGGRRIRVNTLARGPVETEGTRSAGLIGSDLAKQLEAITPLGRLGLPEDVAWIAVFLASDEAGWLTGAWIPASGGLL